MTRAKGILCVLGVVLIAESSIFAMKSPSASKREEGGKPRAGAVTGARLAGDVLVETDAKGRLAVVVDETRNGARPDGIADRVFLLEPSRPIDQRIEERLTMARVV